MNTTTLDKLLRIRIDGPDLPLLNFKEAVKQWSKEKKRRLPLVITCLNRKLIISMTMKSTKVQNPRRKCSAVVQTNCLVAEYRTPYRIGPRTKITHAHRAPLIDGLGHAPWSAT